jgi:hypothetical protein
MAITPFQQNDADDRPKGATKTMKGPNFMGMKQPNQKIPKLHLPKAKKNK